MVEQKNENLKEKGTISRKEFLRLSLGTAAGAAIAGAGLGSFFGLKIAPFAREIIGNIEDISLSLETKKLLPDIAIFRARLGLDGLPGGLERGLKKYEQWNSQPVTYMDEVPEKNKSYSLRIYEVLQKIFGKNATRNIKGAKADSRYPYGISFDGGTRFCNVADSIHDISLQTEFTDFILHEACGHGSDPEVGATYPPEMLVRIEHGKWKALSRAFSIPDQFFNHPSDAMFPLLKKTVGESVGLFMVDDQHSPIVEEQYVVPVREEVEKIAVERGKTLQTLKYNKSVCKEIGTRLVFLLQNRKINFVGDLKNTYQTALENGCVEIYAEMFKYALLYPDSIQNDDFILNGISEIISAINGKSKLTTLKVSISKPGVEILKRNEVEKNTLIDPLLNTSPDIGLSAEDLEKARQEQEEFNRREIAFQQFGNSGKIPATLILSPEQRKIVTSFADHYRQVIHRYPSLTDTFAQQYDEQFDPDMNIWDIRKVEEAMDSGFIRTLVGCTNISNEIIEDIINRITILDMFIHDPAF